jgi:Uma2 family endonuclease
MAAVVEQLATFEDQPSIPFADAPLKSTAPPKRFMFEQALKLADGRPFELIDGRIAFKMADNFHAESQALLSAEFVSYFKNNPIGRVRTESTIRPWPDNPYEMRVPDLAVVLNENIHEGEGYDTRAPDLAVEIVSYNDRWTGFFEKARLYLEKGSRVVWIVDPYEKAVLVITANEQRWVRDTLTCPEVLPEFSIDVQDIFNWPVAAVKTAE